MKQSLAQVPLVRRSLLGSRLLLAWLAIFTAALLLVGAPTSPASPAEQDEQAPLTLPIGNFANGKTTPFIDGKYTTENVPTGKAGIVIAPEIQIDTPQDWSKYDYFKFDVFNPSDEPDQLLLEIRDKKTRDYWTRVNVTTAVPPGISTVSFSTHLYVGEKARPGRMLLRDQITRVVLTSSKAPLTASNFRLERLNTASVLFAGLHALSFGPADAPLMEGFVRVSRDMNYTAARGMGWEHPEIGRPQNALQPDSLTQSFLPVSSGAFRLDLPNGTYHIEMNIDSPGGYWGETQTYSSRKITANGKPVVDEKMTFEHFLSRFYRNAHHEDLPGVDTFDQYVQQMFDIKKFDVDVTAGKLEVGFNGQGWANCLSYMIIYPKSQDDKGKAFCNWVLDRRKAEFNDYFKQIEPKHAVQPASGYAVFSRPMGVAVNAYDGPRTNETVGETGLALTLAKQEISSIHFAVQPSAQELGSIELKVSTFVNESGATLASSCFTPGWIDYRITRVTGDGSIYSVMPRYWHPTPAPSAPGVTRRFWVQVLVPESAPAGIYHGTISIQPEHGEARSIPVALTVLPFALDPVNDVAVGPFGSSMSVPWPESDPKAAQWNWELFSKSLDVLRAGGFTSFTGVPVIHVKADHGTITLDTTLADKEMDLIRSKGFHMIIGSYGAPQLGYAMYGTPNGPDIAAARRAGFASMHDFLLALYTAIDQHAQQHNWVPVAWNLCDEPLGDAVAPAAANARAHRDILSGLKLTTFTGATSMTGDDPANPHLALIQALPMPALNNHDEASLQVVKDAGDQLCFYNGGSRWTYGRYMKMLVLKHDLVMRISWHYNACAGDPYYALDCREDDYCWFNTDENQTMIPSIHYLADMLPGINDYRYFSTLQRLLKEKPNHPAAAAGQKLFDQLMSVRPGVNRNPTVGGDGYADDQVYQKDRAAVADAIVQLLK